jgi:hypothetical protein
MRLPLTAAALACALLLAACGKGGGDTTTKTTSTTAAAPPKQVKVVYATPETEAQKVGHTLLTAGKTGEIVKALAGNFALPWDIKVLVRTSSEEGPHYDPGDHSINLDYEFVSFILDKVKENDPDITDYKLGETVAAIDSFILVHEFAHLLIDAFDLPITGREEDAADQLAALFMIRDVKGGDEYAFDAAEFFDSLARNPADLKDADFFDEHALDQQRAYQIVCWIAGADEANYKAIEESGLLDDARLQRCPEEWRQVDRSWETLLRPHYVKPAAGATKTTTTT